MRARRMLAEGVHLVRPLLGIGRQQLRSFLVELGQEWREDATNRDLTRTRARIRHELLPYLASHYNPRIVETIVRLGAVAAIECQVLDRHAADLAGRFRLEPLGHAGLELDIVALRGLSLAERLIAIRSLWRSAGLPERAMSAQRWRSLAAFIDTEAPALTLAAGMVARRDAGRLLLGRMRTEPVLAEIAPVFLPVPGSTVFGNARLEAVLDPDDEESLQERVDFNQLVLAQEGRSRGLWVRPPRAADRFRPLGLGDHSQPLADFLRSRKVARSDRPRIPVVCDAEGIVWVAGHRIAERVRCQERTQRTLGLRWLPQCDAASPWH
jgi:tRNA(Ile)-lysidine synthase